MELIRISENESDCKPKNIPNNIRLDHSIVARQKGAAMETLRRVAEFANPISEQICRPIPNFCKCWIKMSFQSNLNATKIHYQKVKRHRS
jgi:hypothetical protein